MPQKRRLTYGTWLALALAAPGTVYGDDPGDAVVEVRVVPRHNQWVLVAPAQRAILTRIISMPGGQRDQLLGGGEARLRGIGIFVAEQQGDLATLLSLSALLADDRTTVPFAAPRADVGGYATRDQTVADYLTAVYQEWFGVDVDKSKKRFDDLLGPVKAQPQNLVQPWIVRLRRAQADERAVASIKQSVAELPEEVRWAVITLGYSSSLYTKAEARTLLAALSDQTREKLRAPEQLLPNEPLLGSTSFRDALVRQYDELMK
jgi:hypothetical protein